MTLIEVKRLALAMRTIDPGIAVPSKYRQWLAMVVEVGKLCSKYCRKFDWKLWKRGCGAPDHI